jgi:hypothetical protein
MVTVRAFPNWVGLNISSPEARLIQFFRIFLHYRDITVPLLRESTWYLGYNPRECFAASISVGRLLAAREQVKVQIGYVGMNILQELNAARLGHSTLFPIFHLYPTNKSRRLESCGYDTASR